MTPTQITAIADKHLDRWFAEDPQTSTRTLRSFVEEAIAEGVVNDRALRTPPTTLFGDLVRKHALAVENLTEQQLAEAIRQAIAAGDFQRNVMNEGGTHKQSVLYLPYREVSRLRPLYNELIYAVATKHDNETRHETALRYINERESRRTDGPAESSLASD